MARTRLTQDDLVDRTELLDVLMDYAIGIDSRDWPRYRAIFTDQVEFDFSSWSGNPAARMPADDWVAGVCATLSGFDGTQHMLTNPVVELDGDRATVTLYMNAHHYLHIDGQHHMHSIGGHYVHQMVRTETGWLSEACKLTVVWESGDRALFGIAADRWSAQSATAAS